MNESVPNWLTLYTLKSFPMKKRIVFCCLIISCFVCYSQPVWKRFDSIPVFTNGLQLKNAWAGGLNFINWSELDIDLDGIKELIAFDKSGDKIRCYKYSSNTPLTYTHYPDFQDNFPPVSSFVLFYDYNNDAKEDLFTYSLGNGGIKVYRNTSIPGNMSFTLEKTFITSNYTPTGNPQFLNIIASTVAVPGLGDFDRDGDMDILVFGSGIKMDYHKNLSKELYGHSDSLVYVYTDDCWGDVQETTCQTQLNVCPYPETPDVQFEMNRNPSQEIYHGGSCIMCFDADGDNDKDILLGDISCDSVEFFRNGGIITNAHVDSVSKKYPALNPIKMAHFPCTYFLDVDKDGKRDLLASPNTAGSENKNSNWFFKNIFFDSIPKFSFIKNNFLQDEMLDFGEGAFPALFDYEGDGDLDILVGNFGYFLTPSGYSPQVALLLNTGSASNPQFSLIDSDFLSNETIGLNNLSPAFADMDNDGDQDLFFGTFDGKLVYFQNTATLGSPAAYVQAADFSSGFLTGIDVGQEAYPTLFDLNKDGKKDLIVGEYDGTMNYFENTGTINSPSFAAPVVNFGNVRTNQPGYFVGRNMPVFFDDNGQTKLLAGSERGYLYLYGNIDGNLNGIFTKLDTIYTGLIEGEHVAPAMGDLTNDGIPDLVLGNYSGGLAFLKGIMNNSNVMASKMIWSKLTIFPNPSPNEFNVYIESEISLKKNLVIYDLAGRKIKELKEVNENNFTLDLSDNEKGMYFIEISFEGDSIFRLVKKIILN